MKKACFTFTFQILALLVLISYAEAAPSAGLLDNVSSTFRTSMAVWATRLLNYAEYFFWGLGTISLVYSSAMLFVERADFNKFFAHIIRFIIVFGFFLWLLRNGPAIAGAIIDSFQRIGSESTTLSSPGASSLIDVGTNLFFRITGNLSRWNAAFNIVATLIALGLLVIFALCAANLTIEYCGAWLLIYVGCFFLGFGGSKWTSDIAISYFKAVIACGVRLMTMLMIMGITVSIVNQVIAQNSEELSLYDCANLFIFGLIVFSIMNKLPNMLAGIINAGGSGFGNLGGGSMMALTSSTAAMTTAAASLVTAVSTGGVGAALSSAGKAAISGLGQAMKAMGGGSGSGAGGGLATAASNFFKSGSKGSSGSGASSSASKAAGASAKGSSGSGASSSAAKAAGAGAKGSSGSGEGSSVSTFLSTLQQSGMDRAFSHASDALNSEINDLEK